MFQRQSYMFSFSLQWQLHVPEEERWLCSVQPGHFPQSLYILLPIWPNNELLSDLKKRSKAPKLAVLTFHCMQDNLGFFSYLWCTLPNTTWWYLQHPCSARLWGRRPAQPAQVGAPTPKTLLPEITWRTVFYSEVRLPGSQKQKNHQSFFQREEKLRLHLGGGRTENLVCGPIIFR